MTKTISKYYPIVCGGCDLLKIHYLCGDKDNSSVPARNLTIVVICSKFITFAVTKTMRNPTLSPLRCCDLLKIHYLCGDKDNNLVKCDARLLLWFAQNSLPLRWQRQCWARNHYYSKSCDLLKIHYLCGDKDNIMRSTVVRFVVVICSKFITFAVTKTMAEAVKSPAVELWFAQNSLPLRWQRQSVCACIHIAISCDLLKIHYLCGDKDNENRQPRTDNRLWFAQNSLPLRWQRQY